jgi:hypothetical protein
MNSKRTEKGKLRDIREVRPGMIETAEKKSSLCKRPGNL